MAAPTSRPEPQEAASSATGTRPCRLPVAHTHHHEKRRARGPARAGLSRGEGALRRRRGRRLPPDPRAREVRRAFGPGANRGGQKALTMLVLDASVALAWTFPDE